MNCTAIVYLIVFVAICSAVRFPLQRRHGDINDLDCRDCAGLPSNCFCIVKKLCNDHCEGVQTGTCGEDCNP
ncbi:hypothetical protein OS493_016600, partial [Desmophyllum pertusum]